MDSFHFAAFKRQIQSDVAMVPVEDNKAAEPEVTLRDF